MKMLTPIDITDSMILAGTTVSEPAASETAWVSGGTYIAGQRRIRTSTHRTYLCAANHSGSAVPPEQDSLHWTDDGPTQKWAPFDVYSNTAAQSTGSMTYVLQPGYFNAIGLYGLTGASVQISIKDAPGGTVIYNQSVPLYESAAGWYEYLFVQPQLLTKLIISDLPIRPSAELSITVSAASGAPVQVGMIVVGDYQSLVGDLAEFGGTKYGATAEPVTYSYIDTDEYGNVKIKRRHNATSMRATVVLPQAHVDRALAMIQGVLDVPVAFVAVDQSGYAGLNVFGLCSARVSYDSFNDGTIDMTVKGMI